VTPRVAVVLTHRRPQQTARALRALIGAARRAGWELRFDEEETVKHGLKPAPGISLDGDCAPGPDIGLCLVLGGDGTILTALRRFAGTGIPVFAVNFGEVGFLATVDEDEVDKGLARAFHGDFETLTLPAVELQGPDGPHGAINDVSIHRKVGERVAQLAYSLEGDEVGSVRCDGLVIATPAGSTGYNLANGGPVLAWGVEGYVVSFIAPHSLTARALVVAPGDRLAVHNRGREPVDVIVDGRPVGELGPGEAVEAGFLREAATLAQLPGSTFYRRLREKFGALAS
jgi:NAD+ kinase